jgi:hypothetical protein
VWAAKSGLNRSSTNNTSSGGGGGGGSRWTYFKCICLQEILTVRDDNRLVEGCSPCSSSSSSSRWVYILNVFIYKKFT